MRYNAALTLMFDLVSNSFQLIFVFVFLCSLFALQLTAATQIDIPGPPGTGYFEQVVALPNGNLVVTDPGFTSSQPFAQSAGAVRLYNGRTGELINTLTGSIQGDNVGIGGVFVLSNGDYVISSRNWNLNADIRNVGAVTFCSGITGCSGIVSSSNSLIGSTANDNVGSGGITVLSNGAYIINSFAWNSGRGAITWRNASMGTIGAISEANSLVGTFAGDYIGSVKLLRNGNYVVSSGTANMNKGAVRFCDGSTGCFGTLTSANSLMGANSGDLIAFNAGVKELANGNYVVLSPNFNGNRGAATFGSGTTGITGEVSAANSLVGNSPNDTIGSASFEDSGLIALTNGNYVIHSPSWRNANGVMVGASTFCNGVTGTTGVVTAQNSLTGSRASDFYLSGVTPLTNGNYVVVAPRWNPGPGGGPGASSTWVNGTTGLVGTVSPANSFVGGVEQVLPLANGNYVIVYSGWSGRRGAVTWANGTIGIVGQASATNSLVGSTEDDFVGYGNRVIALTNGNYVVGTPDWDNGSIQNVGAVTFCNGATGMVGEISAANSFTGTVANSKVGDGVIPLTNGNYVISSTRYNNDLGAITWANGTTGLTGTVSISNSLLGDAVSGQIAGVRALPNGNYLAVTPGWNNLRGAVTWGSGTSGVSGTISAANSLVGNVPFDGIASREPIYLQNGYYILWSPFFDNGSLVDAGVVTISKTNKPITGTVTPQNSVIGTSQNGGNAMRLFYDYVNKQLIVSRPVRMLTLFRLDDSTAPFDFDGDGKSDISIFRPSVGEWWYSRSSDSGNQAFQFGATPDKIVPADFTGDGKTDVAVWRPESGEWFVLRSEDSSFYAFPFGTNGDIPIVGDFDADGRADAGIFRESNLTWFIQKSSGGTIIQQFGTANDKPVVGDYDGDGRADIAIFRPNGANGAEWWIQRSSNNSVFAATFGNATDKAVQGDFTGDGKTDIAVWRPSNGNWFVLRSEDFSFYAFPFGANGDVPVAGDYDGDGRFDAGVFRPSSSTWFIQRSTAGTLIQQFGINGDLPTPAAFVP